jgi:serine/threonine protein phosphatase PrpC
LGDFHLKSKEFNNEVHDGDKNYRKSIRNFNGPYIGNMPDICEVDYTTGDYLILATDGLWDYVKPKEIADLLLHTGETDTEDKNLQIFFLMLEKVAKASGIPLEKLGTHEPGPELRKIHDDVTIILVEF